MLKETLLKAARVGGQVILDYFNGSFEISSKSSANDLVTAADKAAETAIIAVIRDAFPDHYILSEEAGTLDTASNTRWIIDPIDGTVNFANGIPICAVSIGVEVNGVMQLGVVYNPVMNEFFFAEKGKGATLNDKPIQVSAKDDLERSFLVTGFPYHWEDMPNDPMVVFGRFIKKGIPVRRLGSAAIDLCWVAAGRFDGFYEHSLNAWDSAAGYLIVEEAGGTVTDFNGQPYSPYQPRILATNGKIHQALLDVVNGK
ncbi:inositol monophosphatase [Chitinophaga parva]|uniref:Inositol-1-monophosphatase n=1 Tax=Chitinophaga parva TaxID=2169414 RepID=A0A2T7BKG5_9BACT|nr:inositol monophosphatase family protein [Chitinophaga parva]PUZ28168.1 inositol monophosphatase [Chitinophaga parva]